MNIHDTKLNEMSANGKDYAAEMENAETERRMRRRREAVNRRVEENNENMRRMMRQKK